MKQRCINCGAQWSGCPNCNAEAPDQETDYSPQDYLLTSLAKPSMKMSLNDDRIEDNNPKYNK